MKEELLLYLLNGISPAWMVAFLLFGLLGQALSILIHVSRKRKGKFNRLFFIQDNKMRIVTEWILFVLLLFLLARFFPDIEPIIGFIFEKIGMPYKLNMFVGFAFGFLFDWVIIFIRNKTKINIFQKSD